MTLGEALFLQTYPDPAVATWESLGATRQRVYERWAADTIALADAIRATVDKANGWVEWHGKGEPPFEPSHIQVRMRSGNEYAGPEAPWDWRHCGLDSDIVAYRIVKQET